MVQNPDLMLTLKITKFSGAGTPVVVIAMPRGSEPQSEPKPTLRLVRDNAS